MKGFMKMHPNKLKVISDLVLSMVSLQKALRQRLFKLEYFLNQVTLKTHYFKSYISSKRQRRGK